MSPATKKLFSKSYIGLLLLIIIISIFLSCNKTSEITVSKPLKVINSLPVVADSISQLRDSIPGAADSIPGAADSTDNLAIPVPGEINVNSIEQTNAVITITIPHPESSAITDIGICYGTHNNVSIDDYSIPVNTAGDTFTIKLDSLIAGMRYYVRAYAKNAAGIGYSNELTFTTTSAVQFAGDLSGTWTGLYIDSSVICKMLMRVQMNVTIEDDKFKGIITATDVSNFPVMTLTGVVNADSTQLTLQPDGPTVFENPWIIAGNRITGAIHTDLPVPPDTIVVKRRYEFTKQ